MTVNRVILVGNLGQNPEKRVMNNGNAVVSVSLATSEKWTDKQGAKQSRTEWHKLVFYDKKAELVEAYCVKGSQLYIEGKLQTREWENKDGQKVYTTEIIVNQMNFLGGKSKQSGQQSQQQTQQNQSFQSPPAQNQQEPPQQSAPNVPNDDFIEDDIPF